MPPTPMPATEVPPTPRPRLLADGGLFDPELSPIPNKMSVVDMMGMAYLFISFFAYFFYFTIKN